MIIENTLSEVFQRNKEKIYIKALLIAVVGFILLITGVFVMRYKQPSFTIKLLFFLLSPLFLFSFTAFFAFSEVYGVKKKNQEKKTIYTSKIFKHSGIKLYVDWTNLSGLELNYIVMYIVSNNYKISIDLVFITEANENIEEYVKIAPIIPVLPGDDYRTISYKNKSKLISRKDWEHISSEDFNKHTSEIVETLKQGNIPPYSLQ